MTDRDDARVHRDKFLGNKVDIKGRTEVVKKVLEVRYAVGTVASGAYPSRLMDYVCRFDTAQWLAMARKGSLVKGTDELLIVFRHSPVSSRVSKVAILRVADRGGAIIAQNLSPKIFFH